MIISEETAWEEGFNDYGERDECPYIYHDLREAWRAGWWHGLVALTVYRVAL